MTQCVVMHIRLPSKRSKANDARYVRQGSLVFVLMAKYCASYLYVSIIALAELGGRILELSQTARKWKIESIMHVGGLVWKRIVLPICHRFSQVLRSMGA